MGFLSSLKSFFTNPVNDSEKKNVDSSKSKTESDHSDTSTQDLGKSPSTDDSLATGRVDELAQAPEIALQDVRKSQETSASEATVNSSATPETDSVAKSAGVSSLESDGDAALDGTAKKEEKAATAETASVIKSEEVSSTQDGTDDSAASEQASDTVLEDVREVGSSDVDSEENETLSSDTEKTSFAEAAALEAKDRADTAKKEEKAGSAATTEIATQDGSDNSAASDKASDSVLQDEREVEAAVLEPKGGADIAKREEKAESAATAEISTQDGTDNSAASDKASDSVLQDEREVEAAALEAEEGADTAKREEKAESAATPEIATQDGTDESAVSDKALQDERKAESSDVQKEENETLSSVTEKTSFAEAAALEPKDGADTAKREEKAKVKVDEAKKEIKEESKKKKKNKKSAKKEVSQEPKQKDILVDAKSEGAKPVEDVSKKETPADSEKKSSDEKQKKSSGGFFASIKRFFTDPTKTEGKEELPEKKVASDTGDSAGRSDEERMILALRSAPPKLSAWLGIVLDGVEEANDLFYGRIRFLLRSLEASESEIDAFIHDFKTWVEGMEYLYVEEFRSELQYRLALALELEDEEDERNRLFLKIRTGLSKTREHLSRKLDSLIASHGNIDDEFWENLEEIFITADLGFESTIELIDRLKNRVRVQGIKETSEIKRLLGEELSEIFKIPPHIAAYTPPEVVLMVGVNGVGKTTTIGKLAHRARLCGRKVMICAADTFRAAAIEQLEVWAKRSGSLFYAKKQGSDPASVAYEAMDLALKENVDLLFIDTAGRLQTKRNLMEELRKIKQVTGKKHPGSPHRTILVIDATTGQNALSQVKLFKDSSGVDELIITKLDGTAKGGFAIALAMQYHIPISYIGLGEKLEDLRPFNGEDFASNLLESVE